MAMYAQQWPAQYGLQPAATEQMGAWYNSWSDLWGDVQGIAGWVSGSARNVQQGAQGAQNAAGNLQNLTTQRVNVSTAILGAVAVGVVVYAVQRRGRR